MPTTQIQKATREFIWFVPFDTHALQSAFDPAAGSSARVAARAQQFTVSLETVQFAQGPEHGWLGLLHRSRDLLITSMTAMGTAPQVQRVHYYVDMNALPVGEPITDFLADTIYVCKDYSGTDRFWLSLQVMDVPTDPKERDSLVQGFEGLTQQVGSIFPIALPYAMLAGAAATAVDKFVNATTKSSPLLDRQVELYPGTRHKRVLLREGNYVFFHNPVDGSAYQLQDDGTIITTTDTPQSIAYAVFSIDFIDDPGPEWQDSVNAQRVATLLSGLERGKNSDPGQASMGFLSDTMQMYSNWKDLQRYTALYQQQQKDPNTLTPQEKALMTSLAGNTDLHPYLPGQ